MAGVDQSGREPCEEAIWNRSRSYAVNAQGSRGLRAAGLSCSTVKRGGATAWTGRSLYPLSEQDYHSRVCNNRTGDAISPKRRVAAAPAAFNRGRDQYVHAERAAQWSAEWGAIQALLRKLIAILRRSARELDTPRQQPKRGDLKRGGGTGRVDPRVSRAISTTGGSRSLIAAVAMTSEAARYAALTGDWSSRGTRQLAVPCSKRG